MVRGGRPRRRTPQAQRRGALSRRPEVGDEPWREAAEVLAGRFEPAKGRRPTRILLPHDPWTVLLAVVVVQRGNAPVVLTRCSVEVFGRRNLRFHVYPKGKLGGVARLLGLGGIDLRDPSLDRALVARTNRPTRVRALLHDPAVSGPLLASPPLRARFGRMGWWRRRRIGPEGRLLSVDADGRVQDVDRLVEMAGLTRVLLDRLAGMGSIERRTPHGGSW